MATAKTTGRTFPIEPGLRAAFILAKPAIVLKGSLLLMARVVVSPRLA